MLNAVLKKLFGNKSDRDLKPIYPIVEQIKLEFAKLQSISDDELRNKTTEFKNYIKQELSDTDNKIAELLKETTVDDIDLLGKDDIFKEIDKLKKQRDTEIEKALNFILPQAFAVVKETARRLTENKQLVVTANDFDKDLAAKTKPKKPVTINGDKAIYSNTWDAAGNTVVWNMVHYDVQLIGGIVLHSGKIAEMGTGEGKTLVSTLPAYLNALAGEGVHLVTVNDYLARRDSEWNAPLFEFHGLKVDCIDYHEPNSDARRNAYLADITY